MTKVLNIPVIMEGTETREQIDFLTNNGVEFAQGFYFSKPIIFPEFEKFLDSEK
jgi:EAL domain-containing protein (putative c-di-GMP-specific phosphodiesterase class I)